MRGSIAFFSTYRPPVPLDIYAGPLYPNSDDNEQLLTDGKSYNYNGREIPGVALKTMLEHTKMGRKASAGDVESGKVTGLVFVSERTDNLETLHFALRFHYDGPSTNVKVYRFSELYENSNYNPCLRMEDSGCFAGDHYFIFVSTYSKNPYPRQPWTSVYRTDLRNGHTIRLTPPDVADLSPSVSPSGLKVAVATFQHKPEGWNGEIEDLKTDIVVMDVSNPSNRKRVITDGGWPSWGSEDVIFFHSAEVKGPPDAAMKSYNWGVFRADLTIDRISRITPRENDAMTPAAINSNLVAFAVIAKRIDNIAADREKGLNYRHIVILDYTTRKLHPVTPHLSNTKIDHYNPFVITNAYGGKVLIGYNRIVVERQQQIQRVEINKKIDILKSDDPDECGVFRVPGVFPSFSKDGKKLAFVDNDFQNVYLADTRGGVRPIFQVSQLQLPPDQKSVFSPVWNQNDSKDTLYVCVGPAFNAKKQVHIYAIFHASDDQRRQSRKLTKDRSNNAFPSTNPQGTKLVFRSTRDWLRDNSDVRPKNLYIMENPEDGDEGGLTRLTEGRWVDTHCQWSPNKDWIVYSSTRDKPDGTPDLDNGLDPGYYSIYLTKSDDPKMEPVRVIQSGMYGAGHVNHPMFSPDGRSLAFSSDLAGVSVEPISLPLFIHSVRPYGDIFKVDLNDPDGDIYANENSGPYDRVTHSRYENSTPHWACITTDDLSDEWKNLFRKCEQYTWKNCPFEGRGWKTDAALAGQLALPKRCC